MLWYVYSYDFSYCWLPNQFTLEWQHCQEKLLPVGLLVHCTDRKGLQTNFFILGGVQPENLGSYAMNWLAHIDLPPVITDYLSRPLPHFSLKQTPSKCTGCTCSSRSKIVLHHLKLVWIPGSESKTQQFTGLSIVACWLLPATSV